MKTGEPKSVVKHTRTITTYYMSDELSEEQLKGNLEGFLSELQLPDNYEADGVMVVTSSCDAEEIDVIETFTKLIRRHPIIENVDGKIVFKHNPGYTLEKELESWDISYDQTMESWQQHKLAKQWVKAAKGNNG